MVDGNAPKRTTNPGVLDEKAERAIEEEIIEQRRVVEVMNGADEAKLLEMQGKNEEEKAKIREELELKALERKKIEV